MPFLHQANTVRSLGEMRARLRDATLAIHTTVEHHFDLGHTRWNAARYRRLLETLWGFYQPLETELERIDWSGSGIDVEARKKTGLIERDLLYLSNDSSSRVTRDVCRELPAIDTLPAGLGALYVVEGSTLGGQVILRALQAQLGISASAGGSFFASYGKNVGSMWRDYLATLERFGKVEETANKIERTALDTFATFDRWMRLHAEDVFHADV